MLLQRKSLAFVAPSGEKYLILFFTSQSAIGYSKENLKIHTGVSGLPYPSLPFFPSLSPVSSLPLPLEVGPLKSSYGGLGERCKLHSWVWGGAPAEIDFGILVHFSLKIRHLVATILTILLRIS